MLTLFEKKPIVGNENEAGLNLIEEFALKAPPVPDWFQPSEQDSPEPPEHYADVLTAEEVKVLDTEWDFNADEWFEDADKRKVTPKIETTIRSWTKQWNQYNEDLRKWHETKELRRLTQWPFFYARNVLMDYVESYVKH